MTLPVVMAVDWKEKGELEQPPTMAWANTVTPQCRAECHQILHAIFKTRIKMVGKIFL
jgi:hypothetical protein